MWHCTYYWWFLCLLDNVAKKGLSLKIEKTWKISYDLFNEFGVTNCHTYRTLTFEVNRSRVSVRYFGYRILCSPKVYRDISYFNSHFQVNPVSLARSDLTEGKRISYSWKLPFATRRLSVYQQHVVLIFRSDSKLKHLEISITL